MVFGVPFPPRPFPEDTYLSGKSIDGLVIPTIFSSHRSQVLFHLRTLEYYTPVAPSVLGCPPHFLKVATLPTFFSNLGHENNQSV